MVQVLHARATTTIATRRKIQESSKSIRVLAQEFGINHKTVIKWKRRDYVSDLPCGSRAKLRTVLTELEQKAICVFRKTTNLPLDDCYIALKDSIPNLSRSNLHRCLKRNGLNVLPKVETKSSSANKKKFKQYEIGYLHIDITEIRLDSNPKFYLFCAIDRVSKVVFVRLYQNQTRENSVKFLKEVIEYFPYRIHTILTDNGPQFTHTFLTKSQRPKSVHQFDLICKRQMIRHRLIKFRHPWTNGQVERMNRTIKDATTKAYHYDSVEQLEKHLNEFMIAYNFAKKLKALKFKTPFEFLTNEFKNNPKVFVQNPLHFSGGLNM